MIDNNEIKNILANRVAVEVPANLADSIILKALNTEPKSEFSVAKVSIIKYAVACLAVFICAGLLAVSQEHVLSFGPYIYGNYIEGALI